MKKKPINAVNIVIPKSPKEILDLADLVNKKHVDLGVDSPLNPLTWDVQAPNIPLARKFHDQAEDLKRQAEEMYEQRDLLLGPIDDLVKQSRDLLKSVYRNEPRKIGEFGYTVNDTKFHPGSDLAGKPK